MALSFYVILLAAGANDILAITFHLSINAVTDTFRVMLFVVPPLAFELTRRICMGLQWRDRETVLHGRETGLLVRLPSGGVVEVHEPLPAAELWMLTRYECPRPLVLEPVAGIPRRRALASTLRSSLSRLYFEDCVEPPTPGEVHELEAATTADSHRSPLP
jgi:quinol---cytochrome-c reductase cytochrome b subunit